MIETTYVETPGTIRVPGLEIPAALTVPSSLEPGGSLPTVADGIDQWVRRLPAGATVKP